jgi:hypothetical protein
MIAKHIRHAALALAASAGFASAPAHAAATIVVINNDPPGVGFNDPTPVAPVGGNTGTTLGAQRLNVYLAVANKWGSVLNSPVPITVRAQWTALSCTATGAVLGSAGAITIWQNFVGAPVTDTWYSAALANKLAGQDLDPANPDINANFNVNLGRPGCLTGTPFYLGLDNNHGPQVDFYTVLLHEIGHGLGFQSFTGQNGSLILGFPSIYNRFQFDNAVGKSWVDMTNAERAASSLRFRKVVWTGPNVTGNTSAVLAPGVPGLGISSFAPSINGTYEVGTASFGAPLTVAGVSGQLMPVTANTTAAGLTGPGCGPLTALDARAVNGNVALIDRGVCGFAVKAKNAQNAGAKAVVIANNAVGAPPGLGGADPTVTIPVVSISLEDATALRAQLVFRSRTSSGIVATLKNDASRLAGADANGRALLFTPNPFQGGSSVSHWDTVAFPNLLMEPSINADLTHEVTSPFDLTFDFMKDIGW